MELFIIIGKKAKAVTMGRKEKGGTAKWKVCAIEQRT